MNHFKRFLLLVLALAVGGGMGYRLIDKWLSDKE